MLDQDRVREATRLTRAGRLAEATALLQRMLRGESASPRPSGSTAVAGREPLIINAKAFTVEEVDRSHSARAASAQPPLLRALLDRAGVRSGFSPGDRIKRAPSIRDLVPEGARFINGTYSNAAGSRAYKLFIPSRYQKGQPLPLVVMLHGCTQSPDDFAAGTRMNFIAEEQTCFVVYPAQGSDANQAKAGTGFAQPISSGAEASLR